MEKQLVVLRLTRIGKKKQAQYRIVVADSKRFVNSKFISIVGWYNPHTKEVELKKDEIIDWMTKGARPSNSVAKLLKANGVKLPDWVRITEKVSKPKKDPSPKTEKIDASAVKEEVIEKASVEIPTEESSNTLEESPELVVQEETPIEDTEKNPE
jgi:small subunit ribosomal protein S16